MAHVTAGKVHFYFGIIFVLIIIIAGTAMKLTSIGGGILLIVALGLITPVVYFWIKNAKKHDHGYTDSDFSRWNKKRDESRVE